MATRVGNDGDVEVGAAEVAELKSWSLDESAAQIEDSAMGDANQTYKAGRKSVTGASFRR